MESKGDHILIDAKPSERVTSGGIIIPDTTVLEGQHFGTVEQTNDYVTGSKGEKLEVGSRVLFVGKPNKIINNRQILYWEC